jgi:chemotaxis family two-component system response regulator Rcp1
LILLDLNLPRKDGRQVLAEIKGDPGLRRIPIVILTTSASDQDVLATYNLHANCSVVKPVGFAESVTVVESIDLLAHDREAATAWIAEMSRH